MVQMMGMQPAVENELRHFHRITLFQAVSHVLTGWEAMPGAQRCRLLQLRVQRGAQTALQAPAAGILLPLGMWHVVPAMAV